jgi:hypothetical protein
MISSCSANLWFGHADTTRAPDHITVRHVAEIGFEGHDLTTRDDEVLLLLTLRSTADGLLGSVPPSSTSGVAVSSTRMEPASATRVPPHMSCLVTLRPLLSSLLEFLFGSSIKLVLVRSWRCFRVLASGRSRRFLRFHYVIEVRFVMGRGHLNSIP